MGRMGMLVDTGAEKFLWEYGINVENWGKPIEPEINFDGVFVSHAHLDHSGLLPQLYTRGYDGSIYMAPVTLDLLSILLRDSLKLQKRDSDSPDFSMEDINQLERNAGLLKVGETRDFTLSSITFHSAGHIPGSVSTLLDSRGKRILFTGDIKFMDTHLMKGADSHFRDLDAVISEATYSYTNHPDRKGIEDSLKRIVQETVYGGGVCVIPSFAVGRTQELLLLLNDLGVPVYIDGMGRRATEAILRHPSSIRDAKALAQAFSGARKVKPTDREKIIEKPCVIITTAGMLNGGPVVSYISNLYDRPDCSLLMTGYQVKGTSGRNLMETGRFMNGEIDVKPRMRIEFLDLSAHTDHQHLLDFYRKTNPKKIILVHGDRTEQFAEELKGEGFDAVAPKTGDTITV